METVTISELKSRLSAYLKKVRAGHPLLILDRNTPIARLERVQATESGSERLAELEREGVVRRPLRPVPEDFLAERPAKARGSAVAALLEERRETR